MARANSRARLARSPTSIDHNARVAAVRGIRRRIVDAEARCQAQHGSSESPCPSCRRKLRFASGIVVVLEMIGSLLMWAPIPLAWMWIGGHVYRATGSLGADLAVIFVGFSATTILAMRALTRLDTTWIKLRRYAGYKQVDGALTQVVVASATLGLVAFFVWYYILEDAFILPFMPSQ